MSVPSVILDWAGAVFAVAVVVFGMALAGALVAVCFVAVGRYIRYGTADTDKIRKLRAERQELP